MKTFASIIADLGGYAVVAEALGLPPKTVSSMRSRNSIPPEHWPALARFAATEGKPEITVDALAALRAPRKPREAPTMADAEPAPC